MRMLEVHDLQAMLVAIERADSAGPLLDPTLWMKNRKKMDEDRELLMAALPLANMGKRMRERLNPSENQAK
jgi:hypothetical protein